MMNDLLLDLVRENPISPNEGPFAHIRRIAILGGLIPADAPAPPKVMPSSAEERDKRITETLGPEPIVYEDPLTGVE